MFSWLIKLLPKKELSRTVFVIFDGDQGVRPFDVLFKKLPHVHYHWVQNSRMSVPNKIKKAKVPITIPSDLGKESVDTFIAMKVVQVCMSKKPPGDVYIVSRDIDFADVVINAAKLFPTIKFTLMIERMNKNARLMGNSLPENAVIQHFRVRTV